MPHKNQDNTNYLDGAVTLVDKTDGNPIFISDPLYMTDNGFEMKPALIENPLTDENGDTVIYKLMNEFEQLAGFMIKSEAGNIQAFEDAIANDDKPADQPTI